jgi:NitT/TauT family transport system substrate-binding protein
MLRPDLKDTVKNFKDLKGKVIASNGQGSVSTYEVGKMLEREGLTIADVDLKVIPFTQMGIAFKNKAIDAAIVIPPFVWQLEEQGLAVPFGNVDKLVLPQPMTIAVIMANTDWIKTKSDLVERYVTALLRGARDYCNAYHGGTNRQEIIDELVNTRTAPNRELLEKFPWPARSPNGKINTTSMLDINKWYVTNKMSAKEFSAERLVDSSFVDNAAKKLGPFQLQNKDSKLPGCRE